MSLRLLIPFLLLSVCGFSQPVLTSDQIPWVGSSVEYYVQNDGAFPQFIAGPDQIWTFPEIEYDRIEMVEYLSPSEFPEAAEMGNINLVLRTSDLDGFIDSSLTFNRLSDEGLYEYGTGFQSSMFPPTVYGQPYKRINLPLTFDLNYPSGTFSTNTTYAGIQGIDSILSRTYYASNNLVDGWGTITIETNDYSVLKQRVIESRLDSVYFKMEGTSEFVFQNAYANTFSRTQLFSPDMGIVVYSVTEAEGDKGQTVYQHRYFHGGTILHNTKVVKNNELELFPNPAINYVDFKFNNALNSDFIASIFDINGRLFKVLNRNSLNSARIDISDLNAGFYFIQLNFENGIKSNALKLIVQKP